MKYQYYISKGIQLTVRKPIVDTLEIKSRVLLKLAKNTRADLLFDALPRKMQTLSSCFQSSFVEICVQKFVRRS